jgi:hypothetical protein
VNFKKITYFFVFDKELNSYADIKSEKNKEGKMCPCNKLYLGELIA